MRKINIKQFKKVLLLLFIFIIACEQEEVIFDEPSHRVVLTSEMNFGNKVNPDEDVSFGDVSSGVVSRVWTFPDNVVDILGSENDKTSNEKTVEVIFNTPGDYNVTLSQVFKEAPFSEANNTQLGSKEVDTTIVIRVLPNVKIDLKANLLNDDGTLGAALNINNNALNEVTASKKVRYSYTTIGEPEDYSWTFGNSGVSPTSSTAKTSEIDVQYKSLGNYDLKFIASRVRPGGADTIYMKDLVKVIPSTDPVTLDGVNENNGKIELEFSRDMDETTFNKSTFSVTIENNGNMIPTQITNAEIKSGSNNIISLTLDQTVYRDDIAKVTYAGGNLRTTDQVNADPFVDVEVTFNNIPNILDSGSNYDYSFENSTAANWPYMWWGGIWGEYDLSISNTQAYEGTASAYIEFRPNGGMIFGHRDDTGTDITFPTEAGQDYEIGVWVYVTDLGAADPGFVPDMRFYWFPDTDWSVGPNPAFEDNFKTNEWVYVSQFVKFGTTGDKTFQIRGWNEFNNQKLSFYMDNLTLKKVNLRP
ncbi:hypothetical protein [Polaribacter marinivivus]|uniref:hypothetical protein n=1 Tax=Polaribacter marinivivus TaxID=1524260 RepID=UPI003D33BACD